MLRKNDQAASSIAPYQAAVPPLVDGAAAERATGCTPLDPDEVAAVSGGLWGIVAVGLAYSAIVGPVAWDNAVNGHLN